VVPNRNPAIPKIVRGVVRHLRVATGPRHRLVERRLGDPLEDTALRCPISTGLISGYG
jgi:hypothetical protein